MDVSKPSSAARRGMESLRERLSRERLNRGCGTVPRRRITSPGICPGFCSESYLKAISSPSGIPLSMVARSVFSSRLHFSLESTITSCCTIMPGPARRCTIFFSFGHGPQPRHRGELGLDLQLRQTTLRLMVAAFSLPTYRSSSVTGSSISMFRPRLVCCPPPPPKNMSNGEPPPPACSCAPLRAALMPPKSYSTRRSLSERISYASVTSRKRTSASGDGFLSGWYCMESLR
mmetsp:Transcript_11482/g.37929  ORF Transcript_11482/g.37929 Transcript_11482/m.37929 type:complete len:232 (-) Transcript_11482:297-992(-)